MMCVSEPRNFEPPTRWNLRDSMTRSRLTWVSSSIVLISSRNKVPPDAASNIPL